MFDTDFIIIFVVILFIFYIPLCWYTESYTNDQSGGNADGVKLIGDITKESGKAISAGLMAPLDLLAQGVNTVIGVITSIPDEATKIGNKAIGDATEPVTFIMDEVTSIYDKLNLLQGSLLTNDEATSKINTEVLKAITNIKTVMDTIVTDITTIVTNHNDKLKEFVIKLPGMVSSSAVPAAEEVAQAALTEFQLQTSTAFNQITTDIGTFNGFIEEQVPLIQGAITKFGTDIGTIVDTTIPAVKGIATGAQKGVDDIVNKTLPTIQGTLTGLTTGAKTLKGSIDNVTKTLIPSVNGLIGSVSSQLGLLKTTVDGITETIIPGIKSTVGIVQGNVSKIQGHIDDAFSAMGLDKDNFVKPLEDFSKQLGDNAANIADAFSAMGLEMGDNFSKPAEDFSKQLGDNAEDITNAFKAMGLDKDPFVEPSEDLSTQIGNNAANIADAFSAMGLEMGDAFLKPAKDFSTHLTDNSADISNNVTDISKNATNISNAFTAMGLDINNFVPLPSGEELLTQIGNNATNISTNVTDISDNVTDISKNATDITNAFSALGLDKDNFKELNPNISQQINYLNTIYSPLSRDIAGFNTTLGQNTTKVGEALGKVIEAKNLTDGVKGIVDGIETDIKKLTELTGTLEIDAEALKTAFNTAIEDIKGKFDDAKGKLDGLSSITFKPPDIPGLSGGDMTLTVPGINTDFIDTIKSELENLKIKD